MAAQRERLPVEMVELILETFEIEQLFEHQETALHAALIEERDSIVSVPTGGGKSLCFEAIATCCDFMKRDIASPTMREKRGAQDHPVTIIVSPLVSLMKSQVEKLKQRGVTAACTFDAGFDIDKFVKGRYSYVLGNPEGFLQNQPVWQAFKQQELKKRVVCLVFDEVHTAVTWGMSTSFGGAFRTCFSQVVDLRAQLPDVPLMCLTATATRTTQTKIKDLLALHNPVIYAKNPDRPNVRMFINRVCSGPECLDWLAKKLVLEQAEFPKTVVFCRRIQECSQVYFHFMHAVGVNPSELNKRLYDMMHSKTPANVKEHILDSLMNTEALPRVVIATKVLGLGVDVKCEAVIHHGPPSTMDDYLQQIGRAGRSGQQSHAIMLYSGHQMRNVEASVLQMLKSREEKCTRDHALQDFQTSCDDNPEPQIAVKHNCCGYCSKLCECGSCDQGLNDYERYQALKAAGDDTYDTSDEEDSASLTRAVTDDDASELKMSLIDLKECLDKEVVSQQSSGYVKPEIIHGLGLEVISIVLQNSDTIFSVDDIIDKCGVSSYATACRVVEVFSGIFYDMDTDLDTHEDGQS